ncbi:MAG TPA: hypothetical protein VD947_03065 [Patescibacteria group bacterium]|nr:hypothetical protein [Patescibacteria group bacterium]
MFLSKIFSIFRKKKDSSQQSSPADNKNVTGPSTVGAAVGLSQPNQSVNPDSSPQQVAQASPQDSAPSTAPSFSDVNPVSDASSASPEESADSDTPVFTPSSSDPSEDNSSVPTDAQPESSPDLGGAQDEQPAPELTPEGEAGSNSLENPDDDNQNLTV